mmetsp:Transcript_1469/g.1552  ORF Transcript_1469/g.1552 Transcript_1469/m.1552 type:complete len:234 (-) Transcript_1469:90-791(-)
MSVALCCESYHGSNRCHRTAAVQALPRYLYLILLFSLHLHYRTCVDVILRRHSPLYEVCGAEAGRGSASNYRIDRDVFSGFLIALLALSGADVILRWFGDVPSRLCDDPTLRHPPPRSRRCRCEHPTLFHHPQRCVGGKELPLLGLLPSPALPTRRCRHRVYGDSEGGELLGNAVALYLRCRETNVRGCGCGGGVVVFYRLVAVFLCVVVYLRFHDESFIAVGAVVVWFVFIV